MRVYCESLGRRVDLPERPERVVSLVSSASEAIHAMGLGGRVAGVSRYCPRYAPFPESLVVGDYLKVDEERLSALGPDLVLVTSGVQLRLGASLAGKGYPVYVLPLPHSMFGILDNVRLLGGLLNEVDRAEELLRRWEEAFQGLWATPPEPRPGVYVECWFGRHQRTVGALSFIHDLVEASGGRPIFGSDRRGYFVPDLKAVERARPDVALLFDEPEWPMDWEALVRERGWDGWSPPPFVVPSTVRRGENIIHDGPSMMDTARWLHGRLMRWAEQRRRERGRD